MKGKFYVIEGQDGSGKTFLVENFKRILSQTQPTSNLVAFGSGGLGHNLRKLWMSDKFETSATTRFFFMLTVSSDALYMAKHLLEQGVNVVMDRGFMSTYVYQILLSQENEEWKQMAKDMLFKTMASLPTPDKVIYIDTKLEDIRHNKGKRLECNHMDGIDEEHLKQTYEQAVIDLSDKMNIVRFHNTMGDLHLLETKLKELQ